MTPTVIDSASGLVIVEKPVQAPGCCIASLQSEDYEGFIDTLNSPSFVDPHVYISVSWVKEVARKLGWTDEADVAALAQEIKRLEAKLEEAEKAIQAIDALESSGFTQRKRQGRPPAAKKGKVLTSSGKRDDSPANGASNT